MRRNSIFSGIAGSVLFIGAALWTVARLLPHVDAAIPGSHLGDNAAALWNVWWFTYALEHTRNIYWTAMLFAPFGTQLSLHTHATTHALLAFPAAISTSIAAGHNGAIACGLALNGLCTYLLARRVLASVSTDAAGHWPAVAAGLMFSLSAFVQLRVLGHINLLHAWVLPLFALALLRLERLPRTTNAAILGLAAAIVVYTDYYYAVYAAILTCAWTLPRLMKVAIVRKPLVLPRLRRAIVVLILVDALVIALIASTGGGTFIFAGRPVSIRGVHNPLTVFWILAAIWIACRFPFRASLRRSTHKPSFLAPRLAVTSAVVLLLVTAPLGVALATVIAGGEYTAPHISWRSSPGGADLLTLVIGHPRHLLTGQWTTSVYNALGIDMMEQSLWLGLVPCAFLAMTCKRWSHIVVARQWLIVAAVFFVIALGPFLRVAGNDAALPLPFAVLRYLPGFSNARIPGRAVVMVNLAIAILTALAASQYRWRARWQQVALLALILFETIPSPAPIQPLPMPDAVDRRLGGDSNPGAVAELPVGLRDGFGEIGRFGNAALIHQMWHERPIVGGFVARLSASVRAQNAATPLIANYLELSTPGSDVRLTANAGAAALRLGVPYLVVNRDVVPAERLTRAELEDAGFELLETAGTRELYVAGASNPRRR